MIHSYNDETFNFQSKAFKYIYISICWKRKSHCFSFSRLPNLAYSFVLFTFCLSALICVHVFVVYHFSISYAGEISTVCLFSRLRYSYFHDSNAFYIRILILCVSHSTTKWKLRRNKFYFRMSYVFNQKIHRITSFTIKWNRIFTMYKTFFYSLTSNWFW